MNTKQPLSLKVQRLIQPTLFTSNAFSSPFLEAKGNGDSTSLPLARQALVEQLTASNVTHGPLVPGRQDLADLDISLTDALLMPVSALGNVYLGEPFDALIVITNESSALGASAKIVDVQLRVELQTASQRVQMHPKKFQSPEEGEADHLAPMKSWSFTFSHDVKELGLHALIVAVQYTVEGEEDQKKLSNRKVFKFQAMNPLSVKTKVNSMGAAGGRGSANAMVTFLEVQVTNTTVGAVLVLELMKFDPADGFGVTVIDVDDDGGESRPEVLQPQDVRQYLYQLEPATRNDVVRAAMSKALGKLDIRWRSGPFGSRGRLQTSSLTRKVLANNERFHVQAISIDSGSGGHVAQDGSASVGLEQPFTVVCRIHNVSGQEARLELHAPNHAGQDGSIPDDTDADARAAVSALISVGPAHRVLGALGCEEGQDECKVQLAYMATRRGMHTIGMLRLVDQTDGYSQNVARLLDILVV